mmetsp:Transcript_2887/g.4210  ORF Transcript_2887/g.4210 Transcript_2887/m.4210 type:complete len:135 (-) Transcript_2887:272-676(-)
MSYSANDNQNYFVQSGRATSRVLAPPGGKTSISFGVTEAPPRKKTPAPAIDKKVDPTNEKVETKQQEQEPEETKATTTSTTETNNNNNETSSSTTKPVSNNVFAKNGGGNVITGRPSSRVLQPPGGKSSIQIGC